MGFFCLVFCLYVVDVWNRVTVFYSHKDTGIIKTILVVCFISKFGFDLCKVLQNACMCRQLQRMCVCVCEKWNQNGFFPDAR